MMVKFARPIHPGEMLKEEYLVPLNMSAGALAKRLLVPRTRIERIIAGRTGITADTALRLARFFNTTPQFWMNMQIAFDLETEATHLKTTLDVITPRQPETI
ncbi:Virulence-associated protein I [Mesorhizobium plurifarium]|uniref:Virulence-associated protein I n=1 Tax=Mesorhizobium plurifarium TaxID=69974 RepID=A0A090G729_MESPL|nr:Virulence-associated protein I [Mesorhizobium plurifarium]